MKKRMYLYFLLGNSLVLHAQQDVFLPGVVVEQNSKFYTGTTKYLSNVSVRSAGASPQLSDANGRFTLLYTDQLFGDVAQVYVAKNGYETVNEEELKKTTVKGRTRPFKVAMCKAGTRYEAQLAYYNIAKDVTQKGYEKRIATLKKEGKQKALLIAELEKTFDQKITTLAQAHALLQKQYKAARNRAQKLADQFVTVNLDDQSESYQRAFRAFLEKDIDGALMILDSANLKQRLAVNAAEKAKEEALVNTLQANLNKRETQMRQDVDQCIFKANLHKLKYEFALAEEWYELALRYQPENVSLAFEFASFLHDQNRFKKATHLYEKVLTAYRPLAEKNPEVYDADVAKTLNNLGGVWSDQNQFEAAEKHYNEALEIRRRLAVKNPEVHEPNVAMTLNNLGVLLSDQNQLEAAKEHYNEALEIRRRLAVKNPEVYESNIAMTLNNLGVLLKDQNQLEDAKAYYKEALEIRRRLAVKNPEVYESNVAMTLNNLGSLLYKQNQFEAAEEHYNEALEIRRRLAEKNPDAYQPDVASVLNNLGGVLSDQNQFEAAKEHYNEALEIIRRLAEKNPDAYQPYVAMILGNLGSLLYKQNQFEAAEEHYNEALEIRRRLAEKNPDVYEPDVAGTLNNLGLLLNDQKKYEAAKEHYNESLEIYRQLARENPNAYQSYVAMALGNLGSLLRNQNQFEAAEVHYNQALEIYSRFADKNPEAYNEDVAETSIDLGLLYEQWLKETGNLELKIRGMELIKEARSRLSVYPTTHPAVEKHTPSLIRLERFFTDHTGTEDDF